MSEINERIDELQARLDNLIRTQIDFQREVTQIRYELSVLRVAEHKQTAQVQQPPRPRPPIRETPPAESYEEPQQQSPPQSEGTGFGYEKASESYFSSKMDSMTASARSDLEKFIGENLLSKIGIVVLILGVGIGAKYAIDKGWITPLMRVVFGYVIGFALVGIAIRLKAKYLNFSAVLLSGGMAIMYFITYFAYSLYSLLDQTSAFALMLIFTVFTVAAAINYSRQVIAHIGLVGAYAIPFLLSDDSGRYAFLFTYIVIINAGILAISLKKYWKPLFYTSFIFTWATYFGWYMSKYQPDAHFGLSLGFLAVFFLTFYVTFLGYKLISKENVAVENVALILANSFIFFGLGFSIVDGQWQYDDYLGVFTLINAGIHLTVAVAVSRMKSIPLDMICLMAALVLTFATIAVPVQLDGNRITLVWIAEAAILFWFGRIKQIQLYEYYAYPLMVLASASLLVDWANVYESRRAFDFAIQNAPFFNGTMLTSLIYVAGFAVIFWINRDERFEPVVDEDVRKLVAYSVACAGLIALYNTFRMEIDNYFHAKILETALEPERTQYGYTIRHTDADLFNFNIIWQINYTLLFLSILGLLDFKKIRNLLLSAANIALMAFTLVIFCTAGLYLLGELRESYLLQTNTEFFARGPFHIEIRYISLAFVAFGIFVLYSYKKSDFLQERVSRRYLTAGFDAVFYLLLWIISSSELINWLNLFGFNDSFKLGLSIWWGVYALILVGLGIYHHRKYLRISSIGLFGVTLAKVFLYDIADLDTISKTAVFISLGVLMLIVAFLYNKFKSVIFETRET